VFLDFEQSHRLCFSRGGRVSFPGFILAGFCHIVAQRRASKPARALLVELHEIFKLSQNIEQYDAYTAQIRIKMMQYAYYFGISSDGSFSGHISKL
jgi:hypothetical protein